MRVGREVKRQVEASELQRRKAQMVQMSDEDRKKLYDSLMTLPKDKRVPALRSAGLDKEADELEHQMAEEHLEDMRKEQLAAINAMTIEERMVALIANGFTDDVQALSAQMSAEKEAEEASETEEKTVELTPDVVEMAAEAEVKKETPKKKGGRPKKQKK